LEFINQLYPVLGLVASKFEVIIVDDASIDHTWKVIETLSRSHSWIKGIQLMKNSGQAQATLCGLSQVTGEIAITMDDDLQHAPDQIPTLLIKLVENPNLDCVFGIFNKKHHLAYRNAGSWLIRQINQAAFKLPKGTKSSGFRVMRYQLVKEIICCKTANPSILVLILGCTRNIASVPITHNRRLFGKSNYTLTKQFRLAFDNICNATMLPLRIVSVSGFSLCIISALLSLYYLIRFFSGSISVQGWTTIVLLITLFSGITLLSLGIIGEYLVRVLREVTDTPPYLIRKMVGTGNEFSLHINDKS